jgi:hypothetical protein
VLPQQKPFARFNDRRLDAGEYCTGGLRVPSVPHSRYEFGTLIGSVF